MDAGPATKSIGKLPTLGCEIPHSLEKLAVPKTTALPNNLPPRLIAREAAAAFVCVSPRLFDEMVDAGRMPAPRILSEKRRAWDVSELCAAVDALPAADRPQLANAS